MPNRTDIHSTLLIGVRPMLSGVVMLLLAACAPADPAPYAPQVTNEAVNVAEVPAEDRAQAEPYVPPPPCREGDQEFGRSSNASGHGSPYYGIISRCQGGVRLQIDLWAVNDGFYAFAANQCPDAGMLLHEHRLPRIVDREPQLSAGIRETRDFLATKMREFAAQCGIDAAAHSQLLDGFEEIYAQELRASWIHNDYIRRLGAINRLGWGDENLAREAREAYAQTH
jgi:hypothetical protein